MYITNIKKIGLTAFAGFVMSGMATAASHSGKDGLTTTTGYSHDTHMGNGLPMLAPGVQELGLSGHLNWEDNTSYNLDFSYGRFATPNWLFGVQAGMTGINSEQDYRFGVFAEYNFLTGTKWVPFVRTGLGYTHPDDGSDGLSVGVDAGIKYFLRSNLAIFASMGGDWNVTGDGGSTGIAKQVDVGLKFYF